MRKHIAAVLFAAAIATSASAAVNRDSGDPTRQPSVITRVVHFIQHLIGIKPTEDIIIPRP